MKKLARFIAPIVIFAVLLLLAGVFLRNPPEPGRRPPMAAPEIVVAVERIEPTDYRVLLESFGTVQPSIRSQLVAQVGGQITWVSPSLRNGGYFDAGEALLRIDARDYEADLAIAEAELIDARRGLVEAKARAEQAREDWANLGREEEPSDLTLRIPQLLAAEARLKSAEARMAKARLALERTEVSAPFAGRVLDQRVDLGQVVAQNAVVADVYATEAIEVRLPLRNRDLPFIDLPEPGSDGALPAGARGTVALTAKLGGEAEWIGDLVRAEGAIDESANQLHVIARIEEPFGENAQHERPLKIGEYVTARLAGVELEAAIVIPNASIYQGSYVYRVEEGLLRRTAIDILWQNDTEAVIDEGLAAGDLLVLTPLGQVTSGMAVAIEDEARPREGGPRRPEGGGPRVSGTPESEAGGGGARDPGGAGASRDTLRASR